MVTRNIIVYEHACINILYYNANVMLYLLTMLSIIKYVSVYTYLMINLLLYIDYVPMIIFTQLEESKVSSLYINDDRLYVSTFYIIN